jgi:hypothetical protein
MDAPNPNVLKHIEQSSFPVADEGVIEDIFVTVRNNQQKNQDNILYTF